MSLVAGWIIRIVLCVVVAVGCAVVGIWIAHEAQDGAVRASVPSGLSLEPVSGSCCLIPANKGLHKGRS